ncbi:MAG: Rv3654c family TadE-like protein [bacterium]
MTAAARAIGTRDRGAASLWALAGAVVVLTVALLVALRTSAVAARHRAAAAADLAALAAAGGIGVVGTDQICPRAQRIAGLDGARLTGCRTELAADGRSGTVDVAVTVTVYLAGLGRRPVTARARAGRLPA